MRIVITQRDLPEPMPRFTVVLVEPRVGGNVGAVARSMSNFGFNDLVLVNPCVLGDEGYRRAKHGRLILEEARVFPSLAKALSTSDISVGTTGIPTTREKAFHRQAIAPQDLPSKLSEVDGNVAILLGREDYGLYNEELDLVDLLVNIPCSPTHPVMNISHAAAIILYELYRAGSPPALTKPRQASGFEKERFLDAVDALLTDIRYPTHRRRRTQVMFRRLVGRATPSKWEFHALMGVLRGASKTIRRLGESPGSGPSS